MRVRAAESELHEVLFVIGRLADEDDLSLPVSVHVFDVDEVGFDFCSSLRGSIYDAEDRATAPDGHEDELVGCE